MARIIPAFLLALVAAVANAQDFASLPEPAALPVTEAGQETTDAAAAVFVNDVNALKAAAAAGGNGFGLGLPESRAAVSDYTSPGLVAPQTDVLPQPIPQNAAAADLTTAAASNTVDLIGADASPTADQPAPVTVASAPEIEQPAPVTVATAPMTVAATSNEARATNDDQPRPLAAAAAAAPTEDRVAIEEQPRPIAAAAAAAPADDRAAAEEAHPIVSVAAAAPMEAQNLAPKDTATKATNLKTETDGTEPSEGSGAHIATFFAVGAACVLAVAAFGIARKRKNMKTKGGKTPGTPKNEMTFFHVQSRLTPPAV